MSQNRRDFLRQSAAALGAASALSVLPPAIRTALAVPADDRTKSIADVQHIVILMQENRSFDHYFGVLRGVRGFGDRFPVPLEGGKPVWHQSDGTREILPFHVDKATMDAALMAAVPHNMPDAQAAWAQGRFGHWPLYKTDSAMGYYKRDEAPFQYALAEAFTLCDAYHCSVQTGTDPNRIVFWSGSNFDPKRREQGLDSDHATAEAVNLRCWVTGTHPTPGYGYRGSALTWPTIPDVLQAAGIGWRIYQDPNDNWTGAMHGCLAFDSFRSALPGSPVAVNGMSHWTLDDLRKDVVADTLPAVSWVLPSRLQSEHPSGPSSSAHGGDFTHQVLAALTASPENWSRTVLFVTFDENDGFFDHVPPPAVPSLNPDGSPAGKSTVDLAGMYYADPGVDYQDELSGKAYPMLDPRDMVSGKRRPWGMGPRVPMYVVSPWTRGGWVCSQVFDHTSVGRFIEARFGVTIPAISPWARAVSGDLTAAFDFETPNDQAVPALPDMSGYAAIEAASKLLPKAAPPDAPQPLFQETGTRPSRALPYELHASARVAPEGTILTFANSGRQGAAFHVYDRLHLDRIPRRYTVEAGQRLDDLWAPADAGRYDLWVYGPNGFVRSFAGTVAAAEIELEVVYVPADSAIVASVRNRGTAPAALRVTANAYAEADQGTLTVVPGAIENRRWSLAESGGWYDLTLAADGFERRFAGRLETGRASVSDPAMALHLAS
ncbi:phosphocholine-specific phospholipase C [Inquilinus sp. CA228]|uniref:phosphocholine-specific phospholipase C n=1 Tax=Inquilinus sp. CA228 TaxID=3455609 RepID=UPI003F8D083B